MSLYNLIQSDEKSPKQHKEREESCEDEEKQIVFSKDAYFSTDNESHTITWLVPNSLKNAMEPIIVELKPNCCLTKDMPHEGQEFGYVLKGNVVLVRDNKRYKLKG